jgi:acetylornithine deacetylase
VLVEAGGLSRGRLIVAAVVDEEHESIGAEALAYTWRADAAVVTEPTGAAHGSRPRDGRDAILRMGRVLGRLAALDRQLQSTPMHRLLGTASLHASTIVGGHELSSYPDRCTLQVERRTLPGEALDSGFQEVQAILAALRREDLEFEGDARLLLTRGPYAIDPDHPLPAQLADAAASAGCTPRRIGMSFWSDAAILGAAGIPTVLFGPGGAGLHSAEEYVRVDDVRRCRDALVALARVFTAGSTDE